MHLFYTPDISGENFTLPGDESSHCMRVLRLHIGDEIFLTNGKGDLFKAIIANEDSRKCEVNIVDKNEEYGKRNYRIHIAVAPTKNIDRIEWFLEKATEIGIDEITPLICTHSERRTVNPERLNRIITAAMKQSLKAYLPQLNQEMRFTDFLALSLPESKFIGYCGDETVKLKEAYKPGSDVVIMIGPEGDFSEEEVQAAREKGFVPINLGSNRYRTGNRCPACLPCGVYDE